MEIEEVKEADEESLEKAKETMYVQVNLKCKKCGKEHEIDVPVACEVDAETDDGKLYCEVVGEVEQYLPQCECGGEMEPIEGIEKVKGYK